MSAKEPDQPQSSQKQNAIDALRAQGIEGEPLSLIHDAVLNYLGAGTAYSQDAGEAKAQMIERSVNLAWVLVANGAQIDTKNLLTPDVLSNPNSPVRELNVRADSPFRFVLTGLTTDAQKRLQQTLQDLIGQPELSTTFALDRNSLQGSEIDVGRASFSVSISETKPVTQHDSPFTTYPGAGDLAIECTTPKYTTTGNSDQGITFGLLPGLSVHLRADFVNPNTIVLTEMNIMAVRKYPDRRSSIPQISPEVEERIPDLIRATREKLRKMQVYREAAFRLVHPGDKRDLEDVSEGEIQESVTACLIGTAGGRVSFKKPEPDRTSYIIWSSASDSHEEWMSDGMVSILIQDPKNGTFQHMSLNSDNSWPIKASYKERGVSKENTDEAIKEVEKMLANLA